MSNGLVVIHLRKGSRIEWGSRILIVYVVKILPWVNNDKRLVCAQAEATALVTESKYLRLSIDRTFCGPDLLSLSNHYVLLDENSTS